MNMVAFTDFCWEFDYNYINYKERKSVHFILQAVHMSSLTKHREVKSCPEVVQIFQS